jgi:formate/nitrite transporter FocA (FNT family)
MFKEEYLAAANGAKAKSNMLKNNPAGYFMLSVLAGMFIGFGILLVFTLSGALQGAPYTKLVMGSCFSVALSLVVVVVVPDVISVDDKAVVYRCGTLYLSVLFFLLLCDCYSGIVLGNMVDNVCDCVLLVVLDGAYF